MATAPSHAPLPMADPLELGRLRRIDDLVRATETARRGERWSAPAALEHACAWLLAGDFRQADDLVLEADRLAPAFALVPDVWGLWPAPPLDPARQQEAALAQDGMARFIRWRQAEPQALWRSLLPQLQADWAAAIAPELCGDSLLILGHLSAGEDLPPLEPPLESALASLVDDGAIAAQPAAACRFWQLMATLRPGWVLARVRAADLCLERGELDACAGWLGEPPPEALANPWYHDVKARHALQLGGIAAALDAWAEAIRLTQADAAQRSLQEVFEQRRREARRGPGVLQVRSLVNRGDHTAAHRLLERLLTDDPQWQPLLSLRDQLRDTTPAASAAPATHPAEGASMADLDAFSRLLDRTSARLQALGIPLPPVDSSSLSGSEDPTSEASVAAAQLDAYSRRLSDYEARFALA